MFVNPLITNKQIHELPLAKLQFIQGYFRKCLVKSKIYIGIGMRLHVVFGSSVGRPLDLAMTKTV